jgi:hypothetical protein
MLDNRFVRLLVSIKICTFAPAKVPIALAE